MMKATVENKQLLEDVQNIYLGNLGTIDTNISLPSTGKNGSQFQWQSDEHLFITDDGKVTRPMPGVGNRVVHLNLTAKLGNKTLQKQYTATVIQEPRKVAIDHLVDLKLTIHSSSYDLPQVVVVKLADGSYTTAEVTWQRDFDPAALTQTISGTVKENGASVKATIKRVPQDEHGWHNPFKTLPVELLGDNPYISGSQTMLTHLKTIDTDQLLFNFRQAVGLPVDPEKQMTGWDAPDCKLRGHTTGHYMSALAFAYFDTHESIFKDKLDYLVTELAKVQQTFTKLGAHPGFLSAYDETQFDELEKYETYPNIWAPYYTLDKILNGLLDSYHYTDNQQALAIATKLGDWVVARLNKLSHQQLTKMWSIYIAGEFGGMISAMVRLYRETGRQSYLQTAKLFSNDKLFVPMLTNYDTLNNMHANQHIPQIIGAVDLYEETGDENYLQLAENFWNLVVNHHSFANGGVGETEMFHEADAVSKYLTDKTDETCASYNMFKLSQQLFEITRNSKYMDYAENVLNNHLLVANDHQTDGGSTYFLPLRPGGMKQYDTDIDNTCCHGTGLENMVRFQKDLYAFDGESLYVNLFYDSQLTLPDDNGIISQQVKKNHMSVQTDFKSPIAVLIRLPDWMTNLAVTVNGVVAPLNREKGYLRLPALVGQNTIELHYTSRVTVKTAPDNQTLAAVFRGPDMLVKQTDEQQLLAMTTDQLESGTGLVPFNTVHSGHYHAYFKVK